MNGPRAYNAGDPVYEGPEDHNIWIDGDNHLWIGSEADAMCWDPEHGSPTRAEGLVSALHEANPAALKDALESAGVLSDADADASETGESGDLTPVSEVRDMETGQLVTATDGFGNEKTGKLEEVRITHEGPNPYHVSFENKDGRYATHVDPSDDESRSPEDVAETWFRAVERSGDVTCWPANDDTEVSTDTNGNITFDGPVGIYGDPAPVGNEPGDRRPTEFSPWMAHESVETVDAADLPFSEVPADE